MTLLNFDATTVKPSQGPQLLPAGWYIALIDESSDKPTKDGAGGYLELRFKVIEGQYNGAVFFARLNLKNNNADTVRIAQEQLSSICHAAGHLRVGDSSELHGKPMRVKLKIRKDKTGEYEDQNEISMWKNINEPIPGAETTAPQAGFATQGFAQAPVAQQGFAAEMAQAAQAPVSPPPPPAAAASAPAGWGAPAAQQPWQEQAAPTPQAQAAPAAQQAAAAPAQPPHEAQAASPPWGSVA